jgi:hypothetical protein
MSRRTVRIAVSAAAIVFSGGLGLWTATAAPADELPPPAVVAPSTSPTAPATTAPAPAAPAPSGSTTATPANRDDIVPCGLCAVPAP